MTKLLTGWGLMRNNSFYETFLNFSHFFNFSHCFCTNYKFEIANMFHFSRSMWSESFNCFKQILGKLFWESVVWDFGKCHAIFGIDPDIVFIFPKFWFFGLLME